MLARLWRLIGLVLLLACAQVDCAWAHAQLLSTDPADGALLSEMPPTVHLRFNEPVSPLIIKLIGADGHAADLTSNSTGGETVMISLPRVAAIGTYVVSWRVASADGHPIGGSLVFSVRVVTGAPSPGNSTDLAVAAGLWVGKTLLYLAMFAGIGGTLFSATAALPPRARSIAAGLCVLGLVIAPVTLVLHGLDAHALGPFAVLEAEVWNAALSTSYGATAVASALAFALAAASHRMTGRPSTVLALLAGTVAALSLAFSGHASVADPQWLTRPAVFLHIGGLLFWIGALLPLWLLLRAPSLEGDRALAGFSRVIPYPVMALLVSGLVLGVIQMGAPGPSWLTAYAAILGLKLALLVGLFGLALWNRFWLTRPVLAGDPLARLRLRRSIGWEMAIVVLILGLVAGWRFTPPPRALQAVAAAAAATEPVMLHLMDNSTMAMVMIAPGAVGPASVTIDVADAEGVPKEISELAVILSAPELGVESIRRAATRIGDSWRVDNLILPVPGVWHVELEVRLSRFELAKMGDDFQLPE